MGVAGDQRQSVRTTPPWGFLELFVISQTLFPALLFLPGTQSIRTVTRIACFAISLVALVLWIRKKHRGQTMHPSIAWLVIAMLYLGLMLFHPTTNTLLAGVAQIALYVSVFAPLLWVPSLLQGREQLTRLLAILLVCSGVNAVVGILQVYNPDSWMPGELSRVITSSPDSIGRFYYRGAGGQWVLRPPGLFDTPGAVAAPGMTAGMLGLLFAISRTQLWKRGVALALSFAGIVAIYLSHVRTNLVILCGMVIVLLGVLALRRQGTRAVVALALAVGLSVGAYTFASSLAGESIFERFSTLWQDDPLSVYEVSRGVQLEAGFTDYLANYPLGAGLGRWGMMGTYFGDPSNPDSPPLWAEIQFPAWILDGGLVLMTLYFAALIRNAYTEIRLTRETEDSDLRFWSIGIVAINVGVIVLTLSFVPFATQIGLQYWFLSGALWGAHKARWQTS